MSPARGRTLLFGLIAADLVFFSGWIAQNELARRGGQVRLAIEGYDPRDLLSGHYVRIRLAAEREAANLLGSATGKHERVQFCLEEREGGQLHASRLRDGSDCKPFLTGERRAGSVSFGVDRFYVDERLASQVAFVTSGPDTYLLATISDQGTVAPIDLVVSGRSLRAGQ
jgi:uncharacterized membrane-anchored protein